MISSCPWTEMDVLRGVCLHVHVLLHKDMARNGRITVHVQCVQSAGSHCGFPWMWTKLDPYRRTKLGLHWLLITSHWLFLITHHACRANKIWQNVLSFTSIQRNTEWTCSSPSDRSDWDPLQLMEPLKCYENLTMFLWQLAVCPAETDYV